MDVSSRISCLSIQRPVRLLHHLCEKSNSCTYGWNSPTSSFSKTLRSSPSLHYLSGGSDIQRCIETKCATATNQRHTSNNPLLTPRSRRSPFRTSHDFAEDPVRRVETSLPETIGCVSAT